jgi:hypothetical protein
MSWFKTAAEPDQLAMGREVEQEHAETIKWLIKKLSPGPGLTDEITTKLLAETVERIAQDHLKELPDYYTRLKQMEKGAGS